MEEELNEQENMMKKPNILLMITHPIENFKRMRQSPNWLVPLSILIVISVIVAVVAVQLITTGRFLDADLGIIFEGDPAITDEFAQGIFWFTTIVAIMTALISVPFAIAVSALIYFVIGKILKTNADFIHYFSLSIYVTVIGTLGGIVHLIYNALVSNTLPDFAFTSLQALFQADGAMQVVLTSISIFSIWQLIITAIGLQIVGRYSKWSAWITVIVMFILSILMGVFSFIISDVVNNLS